MKNFETFIEEKPLYYDKIDYGRIYVAYEMIKEHIKHPKTIHIVGTNGKGSTGRIVAYLAHSSGLSVGHFSSPHILKFNERLWLNGQDSSDEVLQKAHEKLFTLLGNEMSEELTYFEYTTLLAFVVFQHCDLMVLEAGLGGEFDATSVCEKELSIITPIGIDHQNFLGDSIEEIASTKIRSIQKQFILASQVYDEVVSVAYTIAKERGAMLFNVNQNLLSMDDLIKVRWETHPRYLVENARVALSALDILEISYDIEDLKTLELFGRFYPLTPNIRIDVGHNVLASQAIVKALDKEVILVYNSLDDKDYEEVLRTLKPKVKRVEIIKIASQRATTLEKIEEAIEKVGIPYGYFNETIDKNEHYLVFGSFYVVEAFLKSLNREIAL